MGDENTTTPTPTPTEKKDDEKTRLVMMNETTKNKRGLEEEEEEDPKRWLLRLGNSLEQDRMERTEWESYMILASELLQNKKTTTTTTTNSTEEASAAYGAWKDWVGNNVGQIQSASQTYLISRCLQQASKSSSSTTGTTTTKDIEQWLRSSSSSSGGGVSSDVALQVLDDRIQELRTYHAKHNPTNKRTKITVVEEDNNSFPNTNTTTNTNSNNIVVGWVQMEMEQSFSTLFTEEEVYGKYLDLHPHYSNYISLLDNNNNNNNNNNGDKKLAYVDWCQQLQTKSLSRISSSSSSSLSKSYYAHVVNLVEYLKTFLQKTSPLLNIQRDVIDPALPAKQYTQDTIAEILQSYNTAQELHDQWNANQLKQALMDLNMKCGGTPMDRAKRLFLCKTTPFQQLPSKVLLNHNNNQKKKPTLQNLELTLHALLEQLRPILDATIRRAERVLTQTYTERQRELQEELTGITTTTTITTPNTNKEDRDASDNDNPTDEEEEEDEDAPIYNPKGVPLGWDGKPIPYWLFKLHGLNHFYPCEICGNESYRGRRNFEKHFTEAKHSFGMKCLGIPNTQHFHGITKIDDAQTLWSQLQSKVSSTLFDGETQEEYEDSHGNVLTRATYEDLARQGLL